MRWPLFALLLALASPAFAEPVKTSTVGLTKEELELARYLDLLSELELLENLDFLELLPVLEDDE